MNFSSFQKNIKLRLIDTFFSKLGIGLIFTFMPIYFFTHFGDKITGYLMVTNVFLGIFAGIYFGHLSDKLGRKKILSFSESLRLLLVIGIILCNSPSFTSPIITTILLVAIGFVTGIIAPVNNALLIDSSTPEQRGDIYTLLYWVSNISFAIGGIAGGFLFEKHLIYLLLIAAFSSVISTTIVTFFIKESMNTQVGHNDEKTENGYDGIKNFIISYKNIAKDKLFILFLVAIGLFLTLEFQFVNYIAVRMKKEIETTHLMSFELSGTELYGVLNTENSIIVMILATVIAIAIKKFKERNVMIVAVFIYSIAYFFLASSNNAWILVGSMFFATIGELMSIPVEGSLSAELFPDDARGSYSAVKEFGYQISVLLGAVSIIVGSYISSFVMGLIFLLMGLSSIILFNVIFSLKEKKIKLSKSIA